MNPLKFTNQSSRGKYNDLYGLDLHFGPGYPSPPMPSFLKYSERKLRILVPVTLGFLGFSPSAAKASSKAD